MKVRDEYTIRGHGRIVIVEDAPPTTEQEGVLCGHIIEQGGHRWEVRSIERQATFKPQTVLGLMIKSLGDAPEYPKRGEVTLLTDTQMIGGRGCFWCPICSAMFGRKLPACAHCGWCSHPKVSGAVRCVVCHTGDVPERIGDGRKEIAHWLRITRGKA